jgi:hypothetical protein
MIDDRRRIDDHRRSSTIIDGSVGVRWAAGREALMEMPSVGPRAKRAIAGGAHLGRCGSGGPLARP